MNKLRSHFILLSDYMDRLEYQKWINIISKTLNFSINEDYSLSNITILLNISNDLESLSFKNYRWFDDFAKNMLNLFQVNSVEITINSWTGDSIKIECVEDKNRKEILRFGIYNSKLTLYCEYRNKICDNETLEYVKIYNQILDDYMDITNENIQDKKLIHKNNILIL